MTGNHSSVITIDSKEDIHFPFIPVAGMLIALKRNELNKNSNS